MWTQCDEDGNQYQLLEAIVDHKFDDDAVQQADGYVLVSGRKHRKKSTKGVNLCIQWKGGTTSWERLADVKRSHDLRATLAITSVMRTVGGSVCFRSRVIIIFKQHHEGIACMTFVLLVSFV